MKRISLLLLAGLAAACNQQPSQPTATTAPAAAPAATTPAATAPTAAINTPAAKQLLTKPTTEVLDVRTPAEFTTGHLAQARNLNVKDDDFAQQVAKLDTSKSYVLYCRSGKRSSKAADIMYQQGFRHVVNGGGYDDLK
ncbi:rhodanese-like domain-containing protein [Hymenobacter bucti]|uniref:Rhodanese-like domain-containing protein n=1 Tax=Hymenobacter bucti TaxID=1844114 RepID=A0ABW4QVH1_9BACT